MKHRFMLIAFSALVLATSASIGVIPARAGTTIIVNSTEDTEADDGLCTLREAITAANTDTASGYRPGECAAGSGDDTIDLTDISGTVNLTRRLPYILSWMTLNGPGADKLTIRRDGGGDYGIFIIGDRANTTISDLTISGGTSLGDGGGILAASKLTLNRCVVRDNRAIGSGGGICIYGGSLILNRCIVRDNKAWYNLEGPWPTGGEGGGIYHSWHLTLFESTVSGNKADGDGGGIYSRGPLKLTNSTVSGNHAGAQLYSGKGGGIWNGGQLTIENSTISHNEGLLEGGGFYNDYGVMTTVVHSTITKNRAVGRGSLGGGIFNAAGLTLENSIVFDNTASSDEDCHGAIDSQGFNLVGEATGCLLNGPHDQTTTDAGLGHLTDNGGPTETHALLPYSPAIDAGSCPNAPTDQRGAPRRIDIPDVPNISDSCDIGAYEVDPQTGPICRVNSVNDLDDGMCSHVHCSLREAINRANTRANCDTIEFDESLAGQTITLGGSQLRIITADALTIDGANAPGVTINGDDRSRVFQIGASADVTLIALTITGGSADSGGGIYNGGTLTLDNATVISNTASAGGGGIVNTGMFSRVTLVNSTINDNNAERGGGIINGLGTVELTGSMIITNTARLEGGGIYNAGSTTLIRSTVSNNESGDNGGGIFSDRGSMELANSTVISNTAKLEGGGIYNDDNSAAILRESSNVTNNNANAGGGIYNNGGNVELTKSHVDHNEARWGGGIYNDANGLVELTKSGILHNISFVGGGIHNYDSVVRLSGSSVNLNNAHYGGGIYNARGVVRLTELNRVNGNIVTYYGGGIYNSDGTVELTAGSNIDDNLAKTGGGIYNSGIVRLIAHSGVGRNEATSNGGGIYNSGGTVELNYSFVVLNKAGIGLYGGDGGGIYNSGGIVELAKSFVNDNTAGSLLGCNYGGGIYNNRGTVRLTDGSTIKDNEVRGTSSGIAGGGIYSYYGVVELTDSTVKNNTATALGTDEVNGGGIYNYGFLKLTNSTVSGNRVFGRGGGIYNYGGTVALTNSTISGNRADYDMFNWYSGYGGGIFNGGIVRLNNCTISSNIAYRHRYSGGGIYNYDGTVELTTTIVSKQLRGGSCGGAPVTSNGYNLDGDGLCKLNAEGDKPNTDPLLSPLQDNGGLTWTHGLLRRTDPARPSEDSPAIDAAPASLCPGKSDQRGADRPVDISGVGDDSGKTPCDIGAFERQPGETAIEFISFTAEAGTDHVTLAWETGTEVDNAGFNLHRATSADGPYTKLNDALIPAEGDAMSGASYTYTDTGVVKGITYYYKLEDVDMHGASTFHGPVSATPGRIHLVYLPLVLK